MHPSIHLTYLFGQIPGTFRAHSHHLNTIVTRRASAPEGENIRIVIDDVDATGKLDVDLFLSLSTLLFFQINYNISKFNYAKVISLSVSLYPVTFGR